LQNAGRPNFIETKTPPKHGKAHPRRACRIRVAFLGSVRVFEPRVAAARPVCAAARPLPFPCVFLLSFRKNSFAFCRFYVKIVQAYYILSKRAGKCLNSTILRQFLH
jgi:hypothetical protein